MSNPGKNIARVIKSEAKIPPFSSFTVKVKCSSLSCGLSPPGFVTTWTVAHQAPPSMGFPRQEYWSGLSFPSPGELPDPGMEHRASCVAGRFFTAWATFTIRKSQISTVQQHRGRSLGISLCLGQCLRLWKGDLRIGRSRFCSSGHFHLEERKFSMMWWRAFATCWQRGAVKAISLLPKCAVSTLLNLVDFLRKLQLFQTLLLHRRLQGGRT